jgi:hypothetical protein
MKVRKNLDEYLADHILSVVSLKTIVICDVYGTAVASITTLIV